MDNPIKDITSTLFGWDRALLEGDTKESREFREKQQGKYIPRDVLQKIGTECFRDAFNPDFWIDALESRVDTSKNIVIADVRFKNEAEWIKSLGGVVIYLESKTRGIHTRTLHASENGLDMNDVDLIIENDGTVNALHEKLEDLRRPKNEVQL